MRRFTRASLFAAAALIFITAPHSLAQIPGQLAPDYPAGEAPEPAEIERVEKAVAERPNDLNLVRKLGKGYFFQFFGDGMVEAVPKAEKTLERAIEIRNNDAEAIVYLGALHILKGQRLHKKDAVAQKKSYDLGFELLKKAESVDPRHGAVMSVASASYLWLPESYGMTDHVIAIVEGMRKAMGPMFKKFHHHGQQRLLLTLGEAYARKGETEKARGLFEEALAVNGNSREAGLLRHQIAKLPPPATPK